MERGLLWLPLLALFIWLAWAGWNEYQKVEAYKVWAAQFDRAKYDIYAVLGQKGTEITWGKPTRQAPIAVETFSLQAINSIQLRVNKQVVDLSTPPRKGQTLLEFVGADRTITVPFTDPELAAKWGQYLQTLLPGRDQESFEQ